MGKKTYKLKKKQIEKAKEIERAAMIGMEDFPEDPGDELRRFRNIMEELRARGVLTNEEEQKVFGEGGYLEQEKMPLRVHGEYRQSPKRRRTGVLWKAGKAFMVALLMFAGVFTMCMTSEANRASVMDTVSYLMGKNVRVKVNSDVGHIVSDLSETEATAKIQEELDVPMPFWRYRTENMLFSGYELYQERGTAIMHYSVGKNKLTFHVTSGSSTSLGSLEKAEFEEIALFRNQITAKVYAEDNAGNEPPTLSAQWKYDNAYYKFSGNIERTEFKKILESLVY